MRVVSACRGQLIRVAEELKQEPRWCVPRTPSHKKFGRYKYLTHWNLTLQGFMFTFSCFLDFAPIRNKQRLKQFYDHLFVALSLPACLFVTALFWSLYFYDRELIFPRSLAIYYPWWLNQLSHTTISLFALLEAKLVYHATPARRDGFRTIFMLVCTYVGWIVYLGMVHDMWVYPVLEFMSPALLPIFIGCCSFAIFGVYIIGEKINHRFWPTAPVARQDGCSPDSEHQD
ncbi:hypothetical protein MTO96_006466 [Rhipicephalus appendiculatus]